MATVKTPKAATTSYKSLISKTSADLASEQLDLNVEVAKNKFEQGILSVKGQLITKQSKVKEKESIVKDKERSLEKAKSSDPDSLVQNIINAVTSAKQAKLDLETVKEEYNDLKELYDYLEITKKELFD